MNKTQLTKSEEQLGNFIEKIIIKNQEDNALSKQCTNKYSSNMVKEEFSNSDENLRENTPIVLLSESVNEPLKSEEDITDFDGNIKKLTQKAENYQSQNQNESKRNNVYHVQKSFEVEPWNAPDNSSSTCEVCFKKFVNDYVKREHQKSVHEGIRFTCDYCSHSASSKRNLRAHMGYKHTEEPMPMKYNAIKLSQEEVIHQRNKGKKRNFKNIKYKSRKKEIMVGKSSETKDIIISKLKETDMQVNTKIDIPEQKNFMEDIQDFEVLCPHCSNTFRATNLLLLHLDNHHPGKVVPTSFMSAKTDKSSKHVKVHIEPNQIDIMSTITHQNNFRCVLCDMCFRSQHAMSMHLEWERTQKMRGIAKSLTNNHLEEGEV